MSDDEDLKRLEAKKATLVARRRAADSELRRLKSELAQANYKRAAQAKFVVGHGVIAWAENDEKFRSAVAAGIRKYITRPGDLAALDGSVFGSANHA